MRGYTKITKEEFYRDGGFSNPRLTRVTRDGEWTYWRANNG